ncbi:MAG: hypothetical protein AB7E70_19450 [Hyphomicrobiaceae bacterium]
MLILLTVRAAADPQAPPIHALDAQIEAKQREIDANKIRIAEAEATLATHPYRDTLVAQADLPSDAGLALQPPASDGSAALPALESKPSDALANPVDDPIEAYSDLKAAKRLGWAPFLLAIVVMLTAAFARAGQKWPTVKPLAWVAKKKWALLAISGAGLVAAASYNALALGGSAYAALLAAGTAVLALIRPTAPTSEASA